MPWRILNGRPDPYHIWISEVMLQQTTVATVTGFYKKWLAEYPSVIALAQAGEQAVLRQWQGLGYYNRARNLLKCARLLVKDYGGELPSSVDKLKELPGFGPYTVAAVASIAFHRPIPLVDANVRRVMMRVLAIQEIVSTRHDERILRELATIIPKKQPGHFNQAMMELGALICRSRSPICNQCPVRAFCKAYAEGLQELIPEPKVKIIKNIHAVLAIIIKNKKVLIRQRPDKGLLAGLWEFPGGKIEPTDKSPEDALKREVFEETGLNVEVKARLGQVVHFYTQFKVQLTAFFCTCTDRINESERLRLVKRDCLKNYPMPSGSAKIVDQYIHKCIQ